MTVTKPAIEQMTTVSKKTPIDWTSPCSTGCRLSAAAAAIVIVPWPASLTMSPRLIPCWRATPKLPPKMASGENAPANTDPKK